MKFNINREMFVDAIAPAIELAGKKRRNYDESLYTAITSPMDMNKVDADLKKKFDNFSRITFHAKKNELAILSTDGNITLKTKIVNNDLVYLGYECEEAGILTVETAHFWMFMESLAKYDRLVFSCNDGPIVNIQSEQKGAIRNFPKCFYHVICETNHDLKYAGAINPKTLADGIRNIKFAYDRKVSNYGKRFVIAHLFQNMIRLMGSNGSLVAVNDCIYENNILEKCIKFSISRASANTLIKILSKLQKNENVEIWHLPIPRSDKKRFKIVFKQGATCFSIDSKICGDNFKWIDELIKYKYQFIACTKARDWKAIFNPSIVHKLPSTMIEADFIEGYFYIEQRNSNKHTFYLPFSYDSELSYVDIKSIKSAISFKARSAYVAAVFEKARSDDTLRIEFGENCTELNGDKVVSPKDIVVIKFPSKSNKSTKTKQQLIAFLPKDSSKENSND